MYVCVCVWGRILHADFFESFNLDSSRTQTRFRWLLTQYLCLKATYQGKSNHAYCFACRLNLAFSNKDLDLLSNFSGYMLQQRNLTGMHIFKCTVDFLTWSTSLLTNLYDSFDAPAKIQIKKHGQFWIQILILTFAHLAKLTSFNFFIMMQTWNMSHIY